jgi:hypothetical protein
MKYKRVFFVSLLLTSQSPAVAAAWDRGATHYLWGAGIDAGISLGTIDADITVDFKAIVNVLQGGALLRLEGASGQNAVFALRFPAAAGL